MVKMCGIAALIILGLAIWAIRKAVYDSEREHGNPVPQRPKFD